VKLIVSVLPLASLIALGGCATEKVVSTSEKSLRVSRSSAEVVSVPVISQNFILMDDKVCALPSSPSALNETAPSVSLTLPQVTGSESVNGGKVAVTRQLTGPMAYLADQLLYRLCEIGISYDFSKEEMSEAFVTTLQFIDEMSGKNYDDDILDQMLFDEDADEGVDKKTK